MSKGNVNTYGNKKNNFPYQQSVLLLLGAIEELTAKSTTGLAQESTLISVLNAIVASDQDIEILLVRDEAPGNGDPVVKQVTNWQTGIPVITYENVDGTTYVPTPNPAQYVYLDPSAVLQLVLAELIILATPVTGLPAVNLRVTGAGAASVAAGKRRVSFFNAGIADTTVAGAILERGEVTTFVASERDVLASIAYDALTSELLISTVG